MNFWNHKSLIECSEIKLTEDRSQQLFMVHHKSSFLVYLYCVTRNSLFIIDYTWKKATYGTIVRVPILMGLWGIDTLSGKKKMPSSLIFRPFQVHCKKSPDSATRLLKKELRTFSRSHLVHYRQFDKLTTGSSTSSRSGSIEIQDPRFPKTWSPGAIQGCTPSVIIKIQLSIQRLFLIRYSIWAHSFPTTFCFRYALLWWTIFFMFQWYDLQDSVHVI